MKMDDLTIIGRSDSHHAILKSLVKASYTDVEILIHGPTGIGKELYAHYVHQHSPRKNEPFVPVNCGALPNDLFENEFFGHVGGAFTGAKPSSTGLVREAEGGTLFLDEVDSLSLCNQVKLLRFLQEREYRQLGSTKMKTANVRIIAATNCDLLKATESEQFRKDLFFRLRVFPIEVQPLHRRTVDIQPLLSYFIDKYANDYHLAPVKLNKHTLEKLLDYSWPGNIRELQNVVRYLTCLQIERPVVPQDLPLLYDSESTPSREESLPVNWENRPLKEAKQELVSNFERRYLEHTLAISEGNISRAAQLSKKPRRAFFELMRKYEINADDFRPISCILPLPR